MSDKVFWMAYALGYVTNFDNGRHQKISLGELLPEWAGYALVGYQASQKSLNDSYTLYYEGSFGVEKVYTALGTVKRGFGAGHTIHLLNQFIEVHQAEVRYWKKQE